MNTSGNRRVLIVDDTESIHVDFRKYLGSTSSVDTDLQDLEAAFLGEQPADDLLPPFVIDSAYQGADGLKRVVAACEDGTPYAVAFVDMRMPPGWDGLRTIRELWQRDPHLQICICTAYSDYSWEQIVSTIGMTHNLLILKKPFDVAEVRQVACSLAEKWQAQTQARLTADELDRLVEKRTEQLNRANRQLQDEVIDRQRAEEEARTLQQQVEFVLGATRTGMDIVDGQFRLRFVDPEWQNVYGPPTDKTFHEYFLRTEDSPGDAGIRRAFQTRGVVVTEELLPGEADRPVQVTSIPFQNETGEWLCAQINVDIQDRKMMEKELVRSKKLESVGQLAAGIAHEINTPSQYIGDNMRFLQDSIEDITTAMQAFDRLLVHARNGTLSDVIIRETDETVASADLKYILEEVPRSLKQSVEGVERISLIVRSIKSFAYPGGEKKEWVDLNEALSTALTVSCNEWKRVARAETDLDANLPKVFCYGSDLNQVLLNLIINAAQAIAERNADECAELGTISVATRLDGDFVEVSVRDTGCGIPKEITERVFDPFFTTKEVGQGTGQGLAIAYTIVVEKHCGSLEFTSKEGVGTTFRVRLPQGETADGEPEAAVASTEGCC